MWCFDVLLKYLVENMNTFVKVLQSRGGECLHKTALPQAGTETVLQYDSPDK